jgi:hypothetical protein
MTNVNDINTGEQSNVALVDDPDGFQRRWDSIQAGFVDEPRHAVEEADSLVSELIKSLSDGFSDERRHLEEQWSSGQEVSTDDLRRGLQRYRSFFQRLLSQSGPATTSRDTTNDVAAERDLGTDDVHGEQLPPPRETTPTVGADGTL